jgi:arsenite methyltransferase
MVETQAGDRLRELLAPGTPWRPHSDGYLDLLEDEQPATTRSQALWLSRRGPRIYLRLVQPLVRSLGAPPGAARLAAGLRLVEGATVLDVGCGPGVITAGLAGVAGFAVGLDVSAPMLRRAATLAPPNLALVRGNAMRLPFRDATFDAVCSTAVLMLVPDPEAALAEMLRVLAPGGRLAVVVACRGNGLAGRLGAQIGRVAGGRMFAADEIATMLDTMAVDRVHGHANDMISTTYARKASA